MNENELMSSLPVPKAVAKMAIPSVISSLVTVVYNMADTFFVGQTGDPLQVAAVSLTNPIFILFMAFANMFGMGGSAAASMAMGEKNEKRMKQVSAFVTYASLIVGVALAVILMVFMTPVLNMFGANEQTFLYAKGYTFHIAYGAPFIIWSAAVSFVVRAEGASKEAMIGILSGVCVTGLPTAVFSMLMSVSTIVLNQILVHTAMRRWRRSASCLRQTCLSHFYRWDWQTECSRFWDITMVLEITSGLFPWNGIQKNAVSLSAF